jgi:hypothetical protein
MSRFISAAELLSSSASVCELNIFTDIGVIEGLGKYVHVGDGSVVGIFIVGVFDGFAVGVNEGLISEGRNFAVGAGVVGVQETKDRKATKSRDRNSRLIII